MRICLIGMCVLALLTVNHSALARKWKDKSGTYEFEAEFVRINGDVVILKPPRGKEKRVEIKLLSLQDRAYLRTITAKPPAPPKSVWMMDIAKMTPPRHPAEGAIGRRAFTPTRSRLSGNELTFTTDRGPTVSIRFFLKPGEQLANRTIQVNRGEPVSDEQKKVYVPVIEITPASSEFTKETFLSEYTLDVRFGPQRGTSLTGNIYLGLPDQNKSFLAGSFEADITAR